MRSAAGAAGPLEDLVVFCREAVFEIPSSVGLFNQYADENGDVDTEGASAIRRENLVRCLRSYDKRPEVLVVAEAPGPWGCRFSGVPITSEEQLRDEAFPLSGLVSGKAEQPYSEYSARIFWRTMLPFFPRFFVWNAVPFHPHPAGEPLAIRTPRSGEIRRFAEMTARVVEAIGPRVVVALGRKAEYQLGAVLGVDCTYVRHPSQGGAVAFRDGMAGVFDSIG